MSDEHVCKVMEMSDSDRMNAIAVVADEGIEVDETAGDFRETLESILFWASGGQFGRCWGRCGWIPDE